MRTREPLIKRIIGFKYLFIINLVILLFLGLGFGREFVRNREIQGEIDRLRGRAEQLAARNLEIKELQTALQTESFIEREARLKLGLKKPGEDVVIIQQSEKEKTDLEEQKNRANALQSVNNPTKWWYYFFDNKKFELWKTPTEILSTSQ